MREPGFEPGLTPRKGVVLPLDYSRFDYVKHYLTFTKAYSFKLLLDL